MPANATESTSPAAHAPPRVSRARLLLRGGASGSLVLGRLALAPVRRAPPSPDPLSLACGNATNATNATPPQIVSVEDAPEAFGSAFPLVWALHGPPEDDAPSSSYVATPLADAPCGRRCGRSRRARPPRSLRCKTCGVSPPPRAYSRARRAPPPP